MKQHIIRLVVVLILAAIIGFAVYKIVDKNTPFKMNAYFVEQNEKIALTESNLTKVKDKVNEEFQTNLKIFVGYKTDLSEYVKFLNAYEISKEDGQKIKIKFATLVEKTTVVNSTVEELENYLGLSDANADTLNGIKGKLNDKLSTCLDEFYSLNNFVATFVESKIFAGKSYDTTFVLLNVRDIIFETYKNLETKTTDNRTFVNKVNTKIDKYLQNGENPTTNILKLAVEIGKFDETELIENFKLYFESGATVGDFELVIKYLSSEVYYEKV